MLGGKSLTRLVQVGTISCLDEGYDMHSGPSASSLVLYPFFPGSPTFLRMLISHHSLA